MLAALRGSTWSAVPAVRVEKRESAFQQCRKRAVMSCAPQKAKFALEGFCLYCNAAKEQLEEKK